MTDSELDILQQLTAPLEPVPTGLLARLERLRNVRAVLFDLYGTLFISGSGDVGSVIEGHQSHAFQEALEACELPLACPPVEGVSIWKATIRDHQDRLRSAAVEYPEVDIVAVWRDTLSRVIDRAAIDWRQVSEAQLRRVAIHYECRANPVWRMPGATVCLESLRRQGLVLGIISNAQFFTLLLFPTLLGGRADELGFAPGLQYYSYRYQRAKPGTEMFEMAQRDLGKSDISTDQTIYVGNDMLNDIAAATRTGFQTALFAGDQRSLRMREDDDRVNQIQPTLILTELQQLPGCLQA